MHREDYSSGDPIITDGISSGVNDWALWSRLHGVFAEKRNQGRSPRLSLADRFSSYEWRQRTRWSQLPTDQKTCPLMNSRWQPSANLCCCCHRWPQANIFPNLSVESFIFSNISPLALSWRLICSSPTAVHFTSSSSGVTHIDTWSVSSSTHLNANKLGVETLHHRHLFVFPLSLSFA